MKTAGINRCEAGWLLITFNDDEESCRLIHNDVELETAFDGFDRIFMDIPVGLSEDGEGRECDKLLIETLGSDYQDQVVIPPVRPILEAPTYAEANIWTYEYTGSRLNSRTWSLVPRIKSVNRLLDERKARRDVLFESHPELLFMRLNGGRIYQNQSTKAGLKHRLGLIKKKESTAADLFRMIKETYRRNEVEEESIVNAMVLATVAKLSVNGILKSLPEAIPTDINGLKMAIYFL